MPFTLTIAEGKGAGQKFDFDRTRVTIGRGTDNDVVLNDAGVSRNHARIEQRANGAFVLADNGSSNGTELNGRTIELATPLQSGDRIGVGPVLFEFGSSVGGETRITARAPKPLDAPPPPRSSEGETRVTAAPSAQGKAIVPRAGGKGDPAQALRETWQGLSKLSRAGIVGAGALLLVLLGVAAVRSSQETRGLECPSLVPVEDALDEHSYGHGVVADYDCGNKVSFGFSAPSQTRVLFHYLASNVSSPSEVELRVNGKHFAWAPVSGSRGDAQVVTIPPEALPEGGKTVVQFTESQRGKDWAISRVRLETFAITAGDLNAARAAYERGRRKLEERRIAPRNLFDAWKAFTEARRQLEGLADKPALYAEVAQLIKDCERDLDKECARLLFSASRFERYGQDDKAQITYHEVLLHFPADDPSGCRKKAQGNLVSGQAESAQQQ